MLRKVVIALCMLMLYAAVSIDGQNSKKSKILRRSAYACECGISGDPEAVNSFYQKSNRSKEVKPSNKYPWMVSFRFKKNNAQTCGGAIISPFYILTAAHCFHRKRNYTRLLSVAYQAGERLLSRKTEIAGVWIHPQFNMSAKLVNDIGLVRVKDPFPCDQNTRPICLPRNMPALGINQKVAVSGWGDTHPEIPGASPYLMETAINVTDCTSHWGPLSTHFCAQAPGTGTCRGDSGGPAFVPVGNRFYVFGVTSYGPGKCGSHKASAYANVPYFMDWISAGLEKQ